MSHASRWEIATAFGTIGAALGTIGAALVAARAARHAKTAATAAQTAAEATEQAAGASRDAAFATQQVATIEAARRADELTVRQHARVDITVDIRQAAPYYWFVVHNVGPARARNITVQYDDDHGAAGTTRNGSFTIPELDQGRTHLHPVRDIAGPGQRNWPDQWIAGLEWSDDSDTVQSDTRHLRRPAQ